MVEVAFCQCYLPYCSHEDTSSYAQTYLLPENYWESQGSGEDLLSEVPGENAEELGQREDIMRQ